MEMQGKYMCTCLDRSMWDSHSEVDKATGWTSVFFCEEQQSCTLKIKNYVVCMLSTCVINLYIGMHGVAQQLPYIVL